MKQYFLYISFAIALLTSPCIMAQDDWNDNSTTAVATTNDWNDNSTTNVATTDDWNDNSTTAVAATDDWNDNGTAAVATTGDWNDNGTAAVATTGDWNDNGTNNWTENSLDDNWNDNKTTQKSNTSFEGSSWMWILGILVLLGGGAFAFFSNKKGGKDDDKDEDDDEDDDNDEDNDDLIGQAKANLNAFAQRARQSASDASSRIQNSVSQTPPPAAQQNAYFVLVNGQQHGPYSLQQMLQFIEQGRMNRNTQVRLPRSNSWQPAGNDSQLLRKLMECGY